MALLSTLKGSLQSLYVKVKGKNSLGGEGGALYFSFVLVISIYT